jgi:hypothetical protein
MMLMTLREWNGALSIINYDQGWSMVHFLAHGEGGRYQGAFADFINAIGARKPYLNAWIDIFGRDVGAFEQKWRDYWLNLPDNPTGDLYAKATTATQTSFLARAYGQKQSFDTFEEFITSAEAGQLKMHGDDWLPPSLLKDAVTQSKKVGKWSLEPGAGGTRTLVCRYDEKTTWHGTFTLSRNGRIARVSVNLAGENQPPTVARARPADPSKAPNAAPAVREEPKPAPPTTRPSAKVATVDPVRSAMSIAKLHESKGDKPKARAVLERALKENPDSPAAADARAMLQKLK